MTWIASALLTLAGFVSLSLSMKKHHKAVVGEFPTAARIRSLRFGGWLGLILATGLCIVGFGTGYGLVVQTALLNVAGVIVSLTLAYRFGDARRPPARNRAARSPAGSDGSSA